MASRKLPLTIAAACLSLPLGALAHDLWLEPHGAALVLRYGHRGGQVLDLDAAKVKSVRCQMGGAPARDVRAASTTGPKELRTPSRCDLASAFLDVGFWSLTPDGERNLPRTQVPDAVRSWQSKQFAKWVDVRSPAAAAVESVSVTVRRPIGTPEADTLLSEASLTFEVAR